MDDGPTGTARVQRTMATIAFTLIGLSAIAIIVLLVMRAAGVPQSTFSSGPMVVLQLLPLPGLTLGLLLVIASIVLLAVRRSRAAGERGGRR